MAEAPMRVLLVDDEAPARRRLRDLLDDCATALPLTVVGEAQHGREALELLQSAPADLVLFGARNWTELLARPQADRTVLRAGREIETTLPDYRELDDLMEA